jgi:hypothetical protein
MNIEQNLRYIVICITEHALVDFDVHVILISDTNLEERVPDQLHILFGQLDRLVIIAHHLIANPVSSFLDQPISYLLKGHHFMVSIEPLTTKPSVMVCVFLCKEEIRW